MPDTHEYCGAMGIMAGLMESSRHQIRQRLHFAEVGNTRPHAPANNHNTSGENTPASRTILNKMDL